MKRIILTGGGTAGHVMPHLALIPTLKAEGWDVQYIGSADGMERGLMEPLVSKYHPISTGKLRRYADARNLTDPFRVLKGMAQSAAVIKAEKPSIVFSKGGFVSVPVVYAASMRRVPVILHESDMTSGLANKLCLPFAKVICTTFPETAAALGKKAVATGTPLRASLFEGDRARALARFGFDGRKPVLMLTGGSSGAQALNAALRGALESLSDFDILHLCGRGNLAPELEGRPGYVQREFLLDEMPDAYAMADLLISRAGSNTICELLALAKPNLLVPYPAAASRGDQLVNAASFEKRGFSMVLLQENMTPDSLRDAAVRLWNERGRYVSAMRAEPTANGAEAVLELIRRHARA